MAVIGTPVGTTTDEPPAGSTGDIWGGVFGVAGEAVPPVGAVRQTITVQNGQTLAAIEGAVIRYSQAGAVRDTAVSSSTGVAVIAVVPGTYDRTIFAAGFDAIADTVTVATDDPETVSLSLLVQTGNPVNVAPGYAN